MRRRQLAESLVVLAAQLPHDRLDRAMELLNAASGPNPALRANLSALNASAKFEAHVAKVYELWESAPECSGSALALALAAADAERSRERESLEIVWTGPATSFVTARHTSAVLFQLIGEAQSRITIFSFAAYYIKDLPGTLRDASQRGVEVRLVLETASNSAGKLSFDGSQSLSSLVGIAEFYVWPAARRDPGAVMHAKFVSIDRSAALITSANLTEFGIGRNLELGIVVRGGRLPRHLADHVDRLIQGKVLERVS